MNARQGQKPKPGRKPKEIGTSRRDVGKYGQPEKLTESEEKLKSKTELKELKEKGQTGT